MKRLITKKMRNSFNLKCFDPFCTKPTIYPMHFSTLYRLLHQDKKKQRALILKRTVK